MSDHKTEAGGAPAPIDLPLQSPPANGARGRNLPEVAG